VTATDQTGQSLTGTVVVVVKFSAIVPDEIVTDLQKYYPTDFMTLLPDLGDGVYPLGITINSLAYNFNKLGKDSIALTLKVSLTEQANTSIAKGLRLAVDIGGNVKVFDLKMNMKKPTDLSFSATSKEGLKTDVIKGQTLFGKKLELTATFKNGSFAKALQTSANLQSDTHLNKITTTIPCSVLYGGHIYQSTPFIVYSAKGGSGKGKGP